MKIYTKKGDQGETSLWGGKRVLKTDLQVDCYGTVDEANSCLGLARGLAKSPAIKESILGVQRMLQIVAAELASTPEGREKLKEKVEAADIHRMENEIDRFMEGRPKQSGFVLPGGTGGSGALDLARTVVRRAERLVVGLKQQQEVRDEVTVFLNRMSDLLFALARAEADRELVQLVKDKVMEKLGTPPGKTLTLDLARKLVTAAEAKAQEINLPIVTAVVDSTGNLLVLERQDEALLTSIQIAWKKAYTAASLRMPTHTLGALAQPGQPLYGIETTNSGQIVIFGGGFPLAKEQKVFGAVGVSGGTVEQDMEIALAAVSAWEQYSA
ncbi:cob(I)yrinic acid a,c-diamide adenosyltransferase [Candidatus Formimonas warabiya]|uniref:Corrinoid adenosyltransferase n=1 Tax=Formimonas warabiya TaxID=1761012 RepID=A0A3G1KZM7_FORW1|nr:cob(I)yrinic acid a,c-diamide adenosyltransferase [Candidatus Formimonas warabiya]ATW27982.1 ATP:cob(I)alamin adenosyltransferase [Candidatus Formimonas warabiya]